MSEEKQVELLPCPFCGNDAVLRPWSPKGHVEKFWRAECGSFQCGALIGPLRSPAVLCELWNRRKTNTGCYQEDCVMDAATRIDTPNA